MTGAERHYVGLISGTSADGVDAVVVRLTQNSGAPTIQTLASLTAPYSAELKQGILATTHAQASISLDALGVLDHDIALTFAEAANAVMTASGLSAKDITAIGSHGQTLRHRPDITSRFTMQAGDPNIIVEKTGCTVVADFRRRDMAAGGQGAPLAPIIHHALWASSIDTASNATAVLNLGGIANVTLLHPSHEVLAWDTGPASCLMDAWCAKHQGQPYDANGAWAATGNVDAALLEAFMHDPYFQRPFPKSTGREYFNMDWLSAFDLTTKNIEDVQRTLLAFTAKSIAHELSQSKQPIERLIACGGGVHNAALMHALSDALPETTVQSSAAWGVDPDYVEAIAFAWMAHQTINHLPSNVPSVTGAEGARILGGIYLT